MFRFSIRDVLWLTVVVGLVVALVVFFWNPLYWLTYAGEMLGRASGRITVP